MKKVLCLLVFIAARLHAMNAEVICETLKDIDSVIQSLGVMASSDSQVSELFKEVDKLESVVICTQNEDNSVLISSLNSFNAHLCKCLRAFVSRNRRSFCDSVSMGIAYMYVSNMIAGNAWRLDNNDIQIAETNSADIIVNGKTLIDRLNDWTVRHGGEALTTPDFLSQNEKTKSDKIRAFQDRLTDIAQIEQIEFSEDE